MNDSELLNKLERFTLTTVPTIQESKITIDESQNNTLRTLARFCLSKTRLDLEIPASIRSESLKVNSGEIERFYNNIENLKWQYLVNYLNKHAWMSNLYKPKTITDAENALVNFINTYDRINEKTKPSWLQTTGLSSYLLFKDPKNAVEIRLSVYKRYQTKKVKKWFLTKTIDTTTNTIVAEIKGLPNSLSSWTWNIDSENTPALVEAINHRQKAMLEHNLSLASLSV